MRSMNREPADSFVRRVEWQVGQDGFDVLGDTFFLLVALLVVAAMVAYNCRSRWR